MAFLDYTGLTTFKTKLDSLFATIANLNSEITRAKGAESTKSPINHASTNTTYGIGTELNYGHTKLSDSINSTSAANSGVAASPKAVKTAYDACVKGSVADDSSTLTTISVNADNLGGYPSSYYAKQSDMSTAETNISTLNHNLALRIGFPDYSKKVSVTAVPFSAPADGWLWFCSGSLTAVQTITINGSTFMTAGGSSTNWTASNMIPLKSGDTVTFTGFGTDAATNVAFIPVR